MRRQPRFVLIALLYVVLASQSACSTTSHRLGPSRAAIVNHNIEKGDRVLVRYASATNAKASDRSEIITITKINDAGIFGTDQASDAVFVRFDEILAIEYKRHGQFDSQGFSDSGAGKAASKLTHYGFCIVLALGNTMCPDPN